MIWHTPARTSLLIKQQLCTAPSFAIPCDGPWLPNSSDPDPTVCSKTKNWLKSEFFSQSLKTLRVILNLKILKIVCILITSLFGAALFMTFFELFDNNFVAISVKNATCKCYVSYFISGFVSDSPVRTSVILWYCWTNDSEASPLVAVLFS